MNLVSTHQTLKKGDCSILDIVFQCTRTFDSIFFDSSRACETEV
jgi:hypothetical protein